MLIRFTGLGLSLGLIALSLAPLRSEAQTKPAVIPTASPFAEPTAIPASAAPIPIPSAVLPAVPAVAPDSTRPRWERRAPRLPAWPSCRSSASICKTRSRWR